MKTLFLVVLLCFAFQIGFAQNSAQNEATRQLYALFDAEWEWTLKANPTLASYLGDKRYNTLWTDLNPAAIEARRKHREETLVRLKRIKRSELSAQDKLNYDLFEKEYAEALEAFKYKSHLLPINQRGGIQTSDELAEFLQFTSVKDYEDWLARVNACPAVMEQT